MFPEPTGTPQHGWPYHFFCVVDGHQGPLHPRYEYMHDMGMPHLKNILLGTGKLPSGDLMFIFPDRWLNPGQAQKFNSLLCKHPSILADKKPRKVLVVTHQPYIVSDCVREQVRVIKEPLGHIEWLRQV